MKKISKPIFSKFSVFRVFKTFLARFAKLKVPLGVFGILRKNFDIIGGFELGCKRFSSLMGIPSGIFWCCKFDKNFHKTVPLHI